MYTIDKFWASCDYARDRMYKYGEILHDQQNYNIPQLDNRGKPFKTRVATLELYPECPEHYMALRQIYYALGNGILNSCPLQYAMILHDADKLDDDADMDERLKNSYDGIHKKPHVHVVIYFANARYNTGVAKLLKVSSNYVKMFHDLDDRLRYLCHMDNIEKYSYPVDRVIGTLSTRMLDLQTAYSMSPRDMYWSAKELIDSVPLDKYISKTHFQDLLRRKGLSAILFHSQYYRPLCELIHDHNHYTREVYVEREQKRTDMSRVTASGMTIEEKRKLKELIGKWQSCEDYETPFWEDSIPEQEEKGDKK